MLLAATYGQTGRLDEAREQWREVLRVNPDYSLEHRRKVLPYRTPRISSASSRAREKASAS